MVPQSGVKHFFAIHRPHKIEQLATQVQYMEICGTGTIRPCTLCPCMFNPRMIRHRMLYPCVFHPCMFHPCSVGPYLCLG
jgi:hypothetical protein